MSANAQKRRAEKQAKRKKASKEKGKAVRRNEHRFNSFVAGLTEDQADRRAHRDIYSILEDGKEMKRRALAGEITETMISKDDFLQGINGMITMSVKLHSGIAVLSKLIEEGKITLTQEQQAVVDVYERSLVEFTEDVAVTLALTKLGKVPADYPEIVLNLSNVMDQLVMVHREKVIALLEEFYHQVETYATEHKPKDTGMYTYMSIIHEERLQHVLPLYKTGHSQNLLDELLGIQDDAEDGTDDPVDDLQNLPPVTLDNDTGLDISHLAPNDPVSQAAKSV